jgi:hypothetical protein
MAPHPAFAGTALDGKTPKLTVARECFGGMWIDDRSWLMGDANVIRKPLPEASTQPRIIPRLAIMHSNAGPTKQSWLNLWGWMNRDTVSGEAHCVPQLDGTMVQVMPFTVRADCNYKANRWYRDGKYYGAISFETQDNGSATLPTTPWTLAQITSMANALAAICVAYRIPCTATTSAYGAGIGYHSQFPEWSIYVGKTCPGAARIRQMDQLRRMVAERVATFHNRAGGSCPS